jgi:hypothetical protein
MRSDNVNALPGSDLAGFVPRRGDFDMEWDTKAESIMADVEFTTSKQLVSRLPTQN